MKNFFKKALKAGPTFPNVISWICQKIILIWGNFWGTLFLHIKAAFLGIELGKNILANGPVSLIRWPGGKISIGNNVSIISGLRRVTACAPAFPTRFRVFGKGAEILIGDGSEINCVSIVARSQKIEIGKHVMIAPNCIITDSDFHAHWPCESRSVDPGYCLDKPVTIKDYAWIGMNCIILKGVTIGVGAIVGAGSVVTHDVPDYCVACGNPAVIKSNLTPKA